MSADPARPKNASSKARAKAATGADATDADATDARYDASEETFALPMAEALAAASAAPTPVELPEDRYLDRELSWLAFNERVLELAEDPATPLLERVFFLSVFASNLDEFFMVRVAGLKRRVAAGFAVPSATGMSPTRLLEAISERAHEMQDRHAELFTGEILPRLAAEGITLVRWDELNDSERERVRLLFKREIFPVLTPLAVDPGHPFPYISGLALNLAVMLRHPVTLKELFARVKVPETLPRLIEVAPSAAVPPSPDALDTGPRAFVPLEEVIAAELEYLFPGMEVLAHYAFRVTRNEDLEIEEDDAENLLTAMETELRRRRFGPAVRLEVADNLPPAILELLVRELEVSPQDVYDLPAPLDLSALTAIAELDRPSLRYPAFRPTTHHRLAPVETAQAPDIFEAVRRHDILLHHPYDSFSTSVQAFVSQAARDPNVLAIKQTLYRTSGDSPIVDSLVEAATNGKQVLAIVEIKARFDERRNISWARKLEEAGVHVVYGLVGLKTHCKLSLVVRQEPDGLRRYSHIGTGNYHPRTARLYEDYGLFTCDHDVGADLTKLFNQLSGYAPKARFKRLLVSPTGVRVGLIERIDAQADRARAGREAWIKIKLNAIVDEATIDALYRASLAGVPIDLVCRGQCSLRPGVPGLSENIRVRSVLGRFLEHSRIYAFAGDHEPEVWIGSADLMHRNLDRRVETLVSIVDPEEKAILIENIDLAMDPAHSAWTLLPDGVWRRDEAKGRGGRRDIQALYIERRSQRRGGAA